MIFDSVNNRLIDNLGWVDRGSLWVYSINTRATSAIPVGNADHLSLRCGKFGYFMVVCGASISIRRTAEPEVTLASVFVRANDAEFGGDSRLWSNFERCVLIKDGIAGSRFVQIDAQAERVRNIDLSWYGSGEYDLGYQDLVDCMTLPDGRYLIVSVQRSSTLVVIDLVQNRKAGTIALAQRHGNPKLSLRTNRDFLASDYDTLCRVRIDDLTVEAQSRLQDKAEGTAHFIGDYCFAGNNNLLVARPFSSDVLLVDSQTFAVLGAAKMVGEPFVPHRISEGEVLARDGKTGVPHVGRLRLQ